MLQAVLSLPDPNGIVRKITETLHVSWAKRSLSLGHEACLTANYTLFLTAAWPLSDVFSSGMLRVLSSAGEK